MMQPPPNPIAALFANLRRPQIYGGNPFQMQTQQQAESQVDAVGAPPPASRTPAETARLGSARPGPPDPSRRSFMDSRGFRIADAVLGGATISEARAGLDAQEDAKARKARIAELGALVEMSRAERLLFEADPETWFKVAGSRLEDRVVADGSTIASGARGASYTNEPDAPPDQLLEMTNPDGSTYRVLASDVRAQIEAARRAGSPAPTTATPPPPPPGFVIVNPNQAAPTGAAAPQGIDWNRLVQRESGGDQSAVSPKGAFGRAQLMPGTADYVARRLGDPSLAQRARTDPAVNERLGQAYLQEQIQAFGNPAVALAAYNAGPGKAREWVRRFGQPAPGREREWAMQIPYRETRDYVLNILEPR